MYNDFDAKQSLINVNEITDLDFADSQCTSFTIDYIEDPLDFRVFLYEDIDINSEEYHEAVLQLCGGKWSHLYGNNPEAIKRFEIRYRRGWNKAESLYDCCLLLHSKT